jgi:hypothetical protein
MAGRAGHPRLCGVARRKVRGGRPSLAMTHATSRLTCRALSNKTLSIRAACAAARLCDPTGGIPALFCNDLLSPACHGCLTPIAFPFFSPREPRTPRGARSCVPPPVIPLGIAAECLSAVDSNAVPVILTGAACDLWLEVDAAEALKPQQPWPPDRMVVVTTG